MTSQKDKAIAFRKLHEQGTFIIPNFWDVGSAVALEKQGFKALASTSAGFAQAIGLKDGQVTLEQKLRHLSDVAAATSVPIAADFEHGFADRPEDCAANLLRAAETGIVGASIEDWSRSELYDLGLSRERIVACVEALSTLDFPFTLTARAENLLRGVGTIEDTIERLKAFENAGAHVLFAPGLSDDEQIRAVMAAVNAPLNILFAFMPKKTVADYQALGVRRISLGNMLASHAAAATARAGKLMLEEGRFSWMSELG